MIPLSAVVPAVLGVVRSKAGLALVAALALSLALGVATWRVYAWGHRNATEAAVARAEAARQQRARVVAEAQLLDARRAAAALARDGAEATAREARRLQARRDAETATGGCLDDRLSPDVLRALDHRHRGGGAAADRLR